MLDDHDVAAPLLTARHGGPVAGASHHWSMLAPWTSILDGLKQRHPDRRHRPPRRSAPQASRGPMVGWLLTPRRRRRIPCSKHSSNRSGPSTHCDLPCGIYDPAQARIEAESVKACQEKYQGSDDAIFKDRARSPSRSSAEPRQGAPVGPGPTTSSPSTSRPTRSSTSSSGTPPRRPATPSGRRNPAQGQKLLDAIDELSKVFWETKSA